MLTTQEVFDKMVRGLAGQRWQKSQTELENGKLVCAYRGTKGRKCAAGHLLGDEYYTQSMENYRVNFIWPEMEASGVRSKDRPLVQKAQVIHDDSHNGSTMRTKLRDLGKQFGLKWPADVPRFSEQEEAKLWPSE